MNVDVVNKKSICVSCEACKAVCPVDAVQMDFEAGQYLPSINNENCIDCGECIEICPGLDIEINELKDFEDLVFGEHIKCVSAYSKDGEILKNSTSGGLITALVVELLKKEQWDGAFVLDFDKFKGKPARLTLVDTEQGVKKAAKSKYIPVSIYNVLSELKSNKKSNYIIIGTPCQIKSIKKFIDLKGYRENNLLFFGLFCEKTLNFNFINYLENKYAKSNEEIVKLDYRNKEKDGWPGHPKLFFDSGREFFIDRSERINLKEYFQLERCLFCTDKLNKNADISFGDCYIAGKEYPGRSNIIIRTEKGLDIWNEFKSGFSYEEVSKESIIRSQNISELKENEFFKYLLSKKTDCIDDVKEEVINSDFEKKLSKKKRKIKFGQNNQDTLIKISQSLDNLNKHKEIVNSGSKLGRYLIKDLIKNPSIDTESEENIVIVGGELFNKGAQAMTFTTVDQLKRRFPEKNIYLFSYRDFYRDRKEKQKYSFEILPWNIKIKLDILTNKKNNSNNEDYIDLKEINSVLRNTAYIIDINGYALSSQWCDNQTICFSQLDYIMNIMIAKKLSIPIYILPQSIGPFNYSLINKMILFPLFKRYLKYPEKIYPREKDGVNHLKKFTEKNVQKRMDIVLCNDGYNLNNIFKQPNENDFYELNIPEKAIGIIPNTRVIERVDKEEILSIYHSIIEETLKKDYKVFVLRHSVEDLQICREIKNMFQSKEVELIEKDLNAIELENIIKQLNFVIASRYHSIIHSYKNNVPVLAIGWAIKYKEILENFNQTKYFFDGINNLKKTKIIESTEELIKNENKERERIKNQLRNNKNNLVFKQINEPVY